CMPRRWRHLAVSGRISVIAHQARPHPADTFISAGQAPPDRPFRGRFHPGNRAENPGKTASGNEFWLQRNSRLKVVDKAPLFIWQQRSTQPHKKTGGASFHSPTGSI
ncbi:hypothetical protein JY419_18370, partial [Stenotrophomonas maltophilia]|nr:hypothetical protein [Stenotrophomonas maltophilia]